MSFSINLHSVLTTYMSSKTFKYLSYFAVVPGLILMTFFKLKLLIFIPFIAIAYFLKKMALKKAKIENRDADYIETIEKEINNAKYASIGLLGLAVVEAIYKYS